MARACSKAYQHALAQLAQLVGSTRQKQPFETFTGLQTSYTTVVRAVWDHLMQEVIRARTTVV